MAQTNTVKKSNIIELSNELTEVSTWIAGAEDNLKLLDEEIRGDYVDVVVRERGDNCFRLWYLENGMSPSAKLRLLKHYRRVVRDEILNAKKRQAALITMLSR